MITIYPYGNYLHNGYGADASNHDTVTDNPSGGYYSSWNGDKYYNISIYDDNYTVKVDDNGYPYVSCNDGATTFNDIYNGINKGFTIKSVKGS